MNDAWLAHHGIVGMKWGVRRFQNKDGSLTSAGKERYLNSDNKGKPDFSKMSYKEEKKYAKEQSVKMLKEFRKIYDDYMNYNGDDDDTEYEKFYSKYKALYKDFEKQTGYEIIGRSGVSYEGKQKISIQFGRKTNNGYQEWIINEDDYEPDGYWLEDPDKDWQ